METRNIYYKKGYKYQLDRDYIMNVGIKPEKNISAMYINLFTDGTLVVRNGYAWDGPSGPTFDTDTFMRGSLEHDALYQLMRMKLLPLSLRDKADRRLQNCCLQDDMMSLRAWYVYRGVSFGGEDSAKPQNVKKIYCAPKKKRKR